MLFQKMIGRCLSGVLICCLAGSVWAQEDGAGDGTVPQAGSSSAVKTSGAAAFLRMGTGARAQGMGRAFTALTAADPSAAFWNPAGLSYLVKPTGALSGRALTDSAFDTSFLSATGASPAGPGTIAVSLLYFTVGDIEAYDEFAKFQDTFKNAEFVFSGSYGFRQGPVSLGVGVRYQSQKFSGPGLRNFSGATESNTGVGFDVGMLYTPTRRLSFGLLLRDGTDLGDVDHMLSGFTVGAGYLFPQTLERKIRVGLDMEQIKGRPLRLHLGSELEMAFDEQTIGFLRLGISDIFLESRAPGSATSDKPGGQSKFTLGLGVIWNQLGIDLAYVSESFDSASVLSLSYHP